MQEAEEKEDAAGGRGNIEVQIAVEEEVEEEAVEVKAGLANLANIQKAMK